MAHFGPTRRSLLQGTLAASALSLTGFPARAEPQWKKYAGTKLEVILAKGPRGDNLQKYIKEFTELTGIEVESEQIPEQQQRQKCVIELASGKPSFDVVHISYHVQKRQFEKAGWLADLTGFMKDPALTTPDLVDTDFSAAGLQYAKNDKGEMHSLPWSVDYFILYYNKELFQKKGVAVPKTLDEMLAAAEKLTDPKEGTFGFVGRGLRNANMALWTNFYLNYGGEFLDSKGNILTDGPEAVEATKLYQALLTKAAPPGVSGFNWMESMASFTQGRSAMWIDASGWAPPLEDPAASRIVGKVGYTVVPAGPKGQYSATYGDGIGIAAASKNKEAAYLLCQWAVSKTQGARLLQAGGGVPFRNSILNDPEVRKGVKNQGMAAVGGRFLQDQQARPSGRDPGRRIPRSGRRRAHRDAVGRRPRDRIEKGPRTVSPDPGAQRESVSAISQAGPAATETAALPGQVLDAGQDLPGQEWRRPSYWPFVVPALVVVLAIIIFPWAIHDLDEPAGMEGRLADDLRRARQLSAVAERSALRRSDRPHLALHRAVGAVAAAVRHLRGGGVSPEIPRARLSARGVHHADDGDAGRDRAGLDHDVSPAARRAQLPAVAGRPAAAALGVSPRRP